MPLYEYLCADCETRFEVLRPMKEADKKIACEKCGGKHTQRALSMFAAHSETLALSATGGGSCACGGGGCGCGHSHSHN